MKYQFDAERHSENQNWSENPRVLLENQYLTDLTIVRNIAIPQKKS